AAEKADIDRADAVEHARQPLVLRHDAHCGDNSADYNADNETEHRDYDRVAKSLKHLDISAAVYQHVKEFVYFLYKSVHFTSRHQRRTPSTDFACGEPATRNKRSGTVRAGKVK